MEPLPRAPGTEPPLPGALSHNPIPHNPITPCTPPRGRALPQPRGWDGGDPAEDAAAPPRRRQALGKGQETRDSGQGPPPRAAGSAPGRSAKLRPAQGARTERWRRGRLRLSPRLTPASTGTATRRGAGRSGGNEPPTPRPRCSPRGGSEAGGSRGHPPRKPRASPGPSPAVPGKPPAVPGAAAGGRGGRVKRPGGVSASSSGAGSQEESLWLRFKGGFSRQLCSAFAEHASNQTQTQTQSRPCPEGPCCPKSPPAHPAERAESPQEAPGPRGDPRTALGKGKAREGTHTAHRHAAPE